MRSARIVAVAAFLAAVATPSRGQDVAFEARLAELDRRIEAGREVSPAGLCGRAAWFAATQYGRPENLDPDYTAPARQALLEKAHLLREHGRREAAALSYRAHYDDLARMRSILGEAFVEESEVTPPAEILEFMRSYGAHPEAERLPAALLPTPLLDARAGEWARYRVRRVRRTLGEEATEEYVITFTVRAVQGLRAEVVQRKVQTGREHEERVESVSILAGLADPVAPDPSGFSDNAKLYARLDDASVAIDGRQRAAKRLGFSMLEYAGNMGPFVETAWTICYELPVHGIASFESSLERSGLDDVREEWTLDGFGWSESR